MQGKGYLQEKTLVTCNLYPGVQHENLRMHRTLDGILVTLRTLETIAVCTGLCGTQPLAEGLLGSGYWGGRDWRQGLAPRSPGWHTLGALPLACSWEESQFAQSTRLWQRELEARSSLPIR